MEQKRGIRNIQFPDLLVENTNSTSDRSNMQMFLNKLTMISFH